MSIHTAWKVSKYGPEKNSVFVHFSRRDNIMAKVNIINIINKYNK